MLPFWRRIVSYCLTRWLVPIWYCTDPLWTMHKLSLPSWPPEHVSIGMLKPLLVSSVLWAHPVDNNTESMFQALSSGPWNLSRNIFSPSEKTGNIYFTSDLWVFKVHFKSNVATQRIHVATQRIQCCNTKGTIPSVELDAHNYVKHLAFNIQEIECQSLSHI